jgi:hypothetical protein
VEELGEGWDVGGIEADDACTQWFEVVLSENRADDEE